MKKTISATEARKQFYKLLRAAGKPGSQVVITLEGQSPVVLMSQPDFEGWLETLDIMTDAKLVADIKQAEKAQDFVPWEEAKKQLGV